MMVGRIIKIMVLPNMIVPIPLLSVERVVG